MHSMAYIDRTLSRNSIQLV